MAAKAGVSCVLVRNTGTFGTPVWNVVSDAADVTLSLSRGKAEAKRRGVDAVEDIPTLLRGPLSVSMVRDPATDDHDALATAFTAKTVLDLAIADGAIATTGTRYFRADFCIFDFPIAQPLEEVENIDMGLDFAVSVNPRAFT